MVVDHSGDQGTTDRTDTSEHDAVIAHRDAGPPDFRPQTPRHRNPQAKVRHKGRNP